MAASQRLDNGKAAGVDIPKGEREKLVELRKTISGYMEFMVELIDSRREALNISQQNIQQLKEKSEQILSIKEKVRQLDDSLEALSDFASGGTMFDKANQGFRDLQKNINEYEDFFMKKENQIKKIEEVINNTKTSLRNIEDEIEKKAEESSLMHVTVEELRSLRGNSLNENVQRDIVAVKTTGNTQKIAQVKIGSHNKIFVSRLEEADIPKNSLVIEYESLQRFSPQRMFLDLKLDERFLGRVVIRILKEDNAMAINFLHMCAGDLGPSYANTQVDHLYNKGLPSEFVCIGEYLKNGGTSSQSVLSEVDWANGQKDNCERTPWKEGDVRGNNTYEYASEVYIITMDCPDVSDGNCFGVVEDEGLDFLSEAICQHSTKEFDRIKISDCGLVFYL